MYDLGYIKYVSLVVSVLYWLTVMNYIKYQYMYKMNIFFYVFIKKKLNMHRVYLEIRFPGFSADISVKILIKSYGG